MKNFISFALVFAAFQAQAATLVCSIQEPLFNLEIERAVDSGRDTGLFEKITQKGASIDLYASRSETRLTAQLNGDSMSYTLRIGGKTVAKTKKARGLFTGYRANYSNFHIDASDVENADITISCSIK